ncbi:MAG: M13 family metallopeptidase [Paraprevotella sp.]|nr:M13 family metallopeptidase [Paraprevotella sp.]
MKFKHLLLSVPLASMTLVSCKQQTVGTGIDLANLDQTVSAGNDFYQFATGGWRATHPIPAEYSRYGSFEVLYENNNKQLRELIETVASEKHAVGSLEQKIGDLYNMVMDSVKLNKEGFEPIRADLEMIEAISARGDVFPMMVNLMKKGVRGYFSFYIGADIKDSKQNLLEFNQGGLSLGEKGYYIETDSATMAIRDGFNLYMTDLFKMCGYPEDVAADKAKAVLEIETRIAQSSRSATELRDPESNYHKMSVEDLKKDFSGIDWDTLFNGIGLTAAKEVSIGQPEAIHEVENILAEVSVEEQKAYMQWTLINLASSYLSDEFRARNFEFYGRILSGKQQDRPRWKRSVATVEGVLGEGVGRIYVEKYFPAEAKERMINLVKHLQDALAERIQEQDWMSEETKKVALDKLSAFYVKIGYPDKWRDYSGLTITDDSFWANLVRSNEFDLKHMVETKLNKPVDREEWFMTPQTVNAYYNPTTNEICFPAGILQPPFFNMEADDACNFGAIGVVIGHEMTHGFDDKGRQFDKNGNLTDWWAPGDSERFDERAKVMKEFFDNINVLPDLKANGSLTLGENLADHGGLKVAYCALQNAMKENPLETKDGFTPEQRFFLAYANLWASNIREEEMRRLTKVDPHSLGRWRVNGALPHVDAWYDAFGVTEQDSMFIPKEQRVTIW